MIAALSLTFTGCKEIEAGVDEAGRGALAGPVFAAAVIFGNYIPPEISQHLNDSKKLTVKSRTQLRKFIEECAFDYGVASVSNVEIDQINILNASILAMHRALNKLRNTPGLILVDGNRFRQYKEVKHQCIIKGDSLYFSIAAASVLAKTYRDEFMAEAHLKYPYYNWLSNKGYPTRPHNESILKHGLSPLHRLTFRIGTQYKLKFDN